MEAGKAGEAFLPVKEEGKMKAGKNAKDLDRVTKTPLGTAGVMVETTTSDEQDGDPQRRDATFTKTERCSTEAGREKGKKSGSLTSLKLLRKFPCGWMRLPMR